MLVKILGLIDLAGAFAFLMLIFGIHPFTHYLLFCAGLLFLKGLFIFTGEPLSAIDIVSCFVLLVAIFFSPWTMLLWILAFLLIAKGFVSFL